MTRSTEEKTITVCCDCESELSSHESNRVALYMQSLADEIDSLGEGFLRLLSGTVYEGYGDSSLNACQLCGSEELGERYGFNVLCRC